MAPVRKKNGAHAIGQSVGTLLGKRGDRADDHDRLRSEIKQPVEALGKGLDRGNPAIEIHDGDRDRHRAQHGHPRGRRCAPPKWWFGGAAPAAQPAPAAPTNQCEQETEQQRFEADIADLLVILRITPPATD